MVLTNKDLDAYDNKIIDCKVGINIATIRNSKIYNNTIESSRENSDTIDILDNVITVSGNNLCIQERDGSSNITEERNTYNTL